MDILHSIFTSRQSPSNTFLTIEVKLPFNDTLFQIKYLRINPYHCSRILLTQVGTNSHFVLQKHDNKITAYVSTSNFNHVVEFEVVEAVRIALEDIPTIPYSPHV